MRYFEKRLNIALREMAQLAGWHPTKERQYAIYLGDEEMDYQYATSPDQAMDKWVNGYSDEHIMEYYHTTKEELRQQLTAYEYIPEPGTGDTGFTQRDFKSISQPKTKLKIEQWLSNNPLDYKVIVAFGSAEEHSLQPTPGVITYVKTGNAGGDALTPHMILHTFGHAVEQADTKYTADSCIEALTNIISPITGHDPEDEFLMDFCKLLHMRAAFFTIEGSNRGFPDSKEAMYEIIGIYLKNGTIRVSPNKYCDYQISSKVCKKIKSIIERSCKIMLDNAVGEIIYDE